MNIIPYVIALKALLFFLYSIYELYYTIQKYIYNDNIIPIFLPSANGLVLRNNNKLIITGFYKCHK